MASLSKAEDSVVQVLSNEGQLDKALDVLFHMNTIPLRDTYLSLLKACNRSRALHQAKQVQVHLAKHMQHDYLGDYLVMTLARCGAVEDALEFSHTLSHRTVFSWTAIISAYVQRGQGREALELYKCMEEDGVKPNHYTFVALLKACGRVADLEKVRALHNDARRMGLGADVYILTTLVSVYCKCGSIEEAENVFSVLLRHDVVTWNAMLAAYVEQGQASKVLHLFRQILEERVTLDELMFVSALQACTMLAEQEGGLRKSMALEIGMALHANARQAGFCSGPFILTTLINMYSKSGNIKGAEGLVSTAWIQCNSVTLNAMIAAYFEHDQERKSLQLYRFMQEQGMKVDEYTFASVLQACEAAAEKEEVLDLSGEPLKVMSLAMGKALHADAQKWNLLSDVFVCNTLIRIYGRCGAIAEAEDLFTAMRSQLNVRSWTVMLSAYVEHDYEEKALQLYVQMYKEGMSPDQHTFVVVIHSCGILAEKEEGIDSDRQFVKAKSLEIGTSIHADARRQCYATDIFINNTLVSMYGKCGALVLAENLFIGMVDRDEVSWNVLLSAYAINSEKAEKVLQMYRQMQVETSSVRPAMFVIALQACSNLLEGKVEACNKHDKAYALSHWTSII
ncbi:hypothetical protein GOP47_0005718 [Adiantum capillus-veneris]|uniref:Pentatricopeptide repeat-containing protein n=1 Tax=Adiantum capillus-veneris TaxID=13818 RepID=A0A9D4V636_ADICA|nr:hypothetical protein GOP47_0005718 [Adiantum capillus-veneris]